MLLPYVFGVISYIFLLDEIAVYLTCAVFSVLLLLGFILVKNALFRFKYAYLFGLGLLIFLFSIGGIISHLNTFDRDQHYFKNFEGSHLLVRVGESLSEKAKSYKSVFEVLSVIEGEKTRMVKGRILVYFEKDSLTHNLKKGDQLLIANRLNTIDPPKNPGQFNYKQYLAFHQIYHQVYLKANGFQKIAGTEKEHWSNHIADIRSAMLAILKSKGFEDDEYAVAAALLLGKKDELDPQLIQSFASAGAMHVLAVSGLHVGILFLVLNVFLKFMDRKLVLRIFKGILLLIVIWIYALLTGLSPSVVRASTMFSAIIVAGMSGYKSSIFNTIGSSAFLLLVINPYYLMEVGFQLSYLAVISIVYIQPKLYSLWTAPNYILKKIWGITSVSIAAQIGTFPLGLLYFHQFPSLFIFSNLVVIPGAYLILALGIILFAFYALNHLLEGLVDPIIELLSQLLWFFVKGLNSGVKFIEDIPHSLITGIDISISESWLLYGLIVFALFYLAYKRFYWIIGVLLISNAFCLEQVREKRHLNRTAFFTVYDIQHTSAINFIKRGENILITDSVLIQDDQRQLFHIKNNWNKKDAESPIFMNYHLPDSNHHRVICKGFYHFKGDLIAHFHKENLPQKFDKQLFTDVLIVSDNIWVNWSETIPRYNPKLVIIDSSIKGYISKKWQAQLKALHIDYWDVKTQGAFVKMY